MGKTGHQAPDRQNRVLAESGGRGIAVYLLEVFTPGNYIYAGEVELAGDPYQEQQLDASGDFRLVYMFPVRLKPGVAKPIPTADEARDNEGRIEAWLFRREISLAKLHALAKMSRPRPDRRLSKGEVTIRNPIVSTYVKLVAQGYCDLCLSLAPFRMKAGDPYFDCHHIQWLARGGEDTINNAVALCPNCHRRMHALGKPSDKKNLRQRVARRDS